MAPPILTLPSAVDTRVAGIETIVQSTHLDEEGKQILAKQLEANAEVCTTQVGKTNMLTHKIILTHNMPIKQKSYRCSPAKEMKAHVEEMLADGVIVPSISPYAAPVVLVPNKSPINRFSV